MTAAAGNSQQYATTEDRIEEWGRHVHIHHTLKAATVHKRVEILKRVVREGGGEAGLYSDDPQKVGLRLHGGRRHGRQETALVREVVSVLTDFRGWASRAH